MCICGIKCFFFISSFFFSSNTFFGRNDWAESIEPSDVDPLGTSRQLSQPIKHISSLLTFLYNFFSPHDYIRVVRLFAKDLEKYYWNYIISANQFSYSGGIQLQKDIGELWAAFRLPSEISFRRYVLFILFFSGLNFYK